MPTMSSTRVHVPDLKLGIARVGPEESHHATHVLRVRSGDAVVAFDGAGREGQAVVTSIKRNALEIDISDVVERPFDAPLRLTVAVAMGKVHRQGFLIEKCTELGAAAIWPMLAHRNVAIPKDSATQKHQRRAIEAAKQSQRAWVPEIRSPQTFDDVLAVRTSFDFAFIADTTTSPRRLSAAISDATENAGILTLVGPEGGWTDEERKRAENAGFSKISLSPTILRTETAAVAICAAIAMHERSY
jgi:16S rRNA (uracil1498-N3)-methyltransferase